MADIDEVKKAVEKELLKKGNVVSVGIGYKKVAGKTTGELSLVCGVLKKLPLEALRKEDVIPQMIDNVNTDVVEVGEIVAFQLRTEKIRPAPRGISIGHVKVTAGTLGCPVKKDGETYILSNNHVLANSNSAEIGDEIIQQGAYDGGVAGINTIAHLSDFVYINFINEPSTCPVAGLYAWVGNMVARLFGRKSRLLAYTTDYKENLVDCAIAKPVSIGDVSPLSFEGWAVLTGKKSAELRMEVRKSGRTTGSTFGRITQVSVTIQVGYGGNRVAVFSEQFIVESDTQSQFSAPGDSGSIIQDLDDNAVGLLFAGSDKVTVCNRIENVESHLEISI